MDNEADFRVTYHPSYGYDVEWVGIARMRIGAQASFEADHRAKADVVEKVRRGPAVVVESYLRNHGFGFHAAAVASSGKAIVLMGCSGAGKSTLAASMCLNGAALLGDDATLVVREGDRWCVRFTEGVHCVDAHSARLLGIPHGERGKRTAAAPRVAENVSLSAFVELAIAEIEQPKIHRLFGCESMTAVARNQMRVLTGERWRLVADLNANAELCRLPVYRLERPRRVNTLDEVRCLVESIAHEP